MVRWFEYSMRMTLDTFDHKILAMLGRDARMTVSALAEHIGLSQSACTRRLQTLESEGVIASYHPRFGWEVLGFHIVAYVAITLASQAETALEAFEAGVAHIPGVIECALVSGEHDYHVKIIARDLVDYERIHREGLGQLPGVARISTSFVLRAITTPGEAAAILTPVKRPHKPI